MQIGVEDGDRKFLQNGHVLLLGHTSSHQSGRYSLKINYF
jgi:hypothetical protein